MIPPKPVSGDGRGTVLGLARAFRRDLLSALPSRLYRAWMAEFRSPVIHSFICNDPALVELVLKTRPADFPKSRRLQAGLAPLLGNSVFVANGEDWARARRIIDPAFEGGRLRHAFPAMWDAGMAAVARMEAQAGREIDLEPETSHATADVIFRTLFSLPIEHRTATQVFDAFRAHQDAQPLVNLGAILPLPAWLRPHSRRTRATAARIRGLIETLVADRRAAIEMGTAPDDLATKIMTTADPETGHRFTHREMVDQVATFFLAGHETSASALAWAVWLLAAFPDWQERVAAEAREALDPAAPDFTAAGRLKLSRAVFREAMRLYPPVPMYVREAARAERFRDRRVPKGAQIVLSPWHLHRHERLWEAPDDFDPGRWETENGRDCARRAYIPFSAGQRVCPGAGFAMLEGPLLLSLACRALRFERGAVDPVPAARLTVRGRDGIRLRIARRE
ncbi:cytochrome P450 [Paracoccus sp. S-4012]|uniref:cytochrome P450 n=1 Tax=Paracoccus sp. S-4012 TaxID=2665648 RepID=UPI0012B09A56|nr:cytochrome P450 [Paracoccus sp. S-4012]MRX49626.1 cytochrome P450 [Paracoccus sp. S-4012]